MTNLRTNLLFYFYFFSLYVFLFTNLRTNNNDNFSDYFLLLKCFDFLFYFSGQFNDFNCLGSNVDNNFNCYSNENDDNLGMNFLFMFSSFYG